MIVKLWKVLRNEESRSRLGLRIGGSRLFVWIVTGDLRLRRSMRDLVFRTRLRWIFLGTWWMERPALFGQRFDARVDGLLVQARERLAEEYEATGDEV